MTQFYFRGGAALSERDNANVYIGKAGKSGHMTRDESCGRCGGWGGSDAWKFTGWTCYQCGGRCKLPYTHRVFTLERLEQLDAAAQKRTDKRVAEAAAKAERQQREFNEWAKPHAKLIEQIEASENSFLQDLTRKLHAHWMLSERQLEAAAKAIERDAERVAQDAASEWVGEVKQRLDLELKVLGVFDHDGFYGHVDIVKMVDRNGNLFTWFASDYTEIERGDNLALRGTVKKHDLYQGTKQTVLTCCKFEKYIVVTADEAASMEDIT